MISPNEQERRAISILAAAPEGKIFIAFLKRDLEYKDEANRQKEDTEMYRGQGGAIEIDELIKLVK